MFTRKRWVPPVLSGDWKKDGPDLLRSINEYLLSLEGKESLELDQIASIASNGPIDISASGSGQIVFPATQNASSNSNTLDDYEEGSATPTPTSGSGSFTTVSAVTNYTKVGNLVRVRAAVVITTNGTAAGYVSIPMPFTAADTTAIAGTDNAGAFGLCGYVTGANMLVYKYDGTYPGADGRTLQMSCVFRV